MAATTEERLEARLDEEERILVEAFTNAVLDRESRTVLLPDHPLPAGWSHDRTDVLFAYPTNYPGGVPDNVCVRPDLTVATGGTPGNSMGVVTHAGRGWLQLSWHVDGKWAPTADPTVGDNLTTYLIGALARLEEPS